MHAKESHQIKHRMLLRHTRAIGDANWCGAWRSVDDVRCRLRVLYRLRDCTTVGQKPCPGFASRLGALCVIFPYFSRLYDYWHRANSLSREELVQRRRRDSPHFVTESLYKSMTKGLGQTQRIVFINDSTNIMVRGYSVATAEAHAPRWR